MTMHNASISNIAWPADQDEEALDLAATLGFAGIEVAPAKVFGGLDAAHEAAVIRYKDRLAAGNLAVPALQAIMFGVSDVHLFASREARERLTLRLEQVCRIAEAIGAHACVFGSPALRDPGDLDPTEAWRIATDFFANVASSFASRGVALCIEANPPRYGCRFVTTTQEAIALVKAVDQAGFALHLDTGTVMINKEEAGLVEKAGAMAAHMHVSEPDLASLGTFGAADHAGIGAAVARSGYGLWRSVEMRACDDWRSAMIQAAQIVQNYYTGPGATLSER